MRLFFTSSQAFHTQLTALYDLINPTAAAMWNLRWQVRGYLGERENADNRELYGRFVAGSGIGSANLRRHSVERTWEEQLGELSLLMLFSAIGLYEGWTFALEVGSNAQRDRLQFPSRGVTGRTTLGVGDTVAALQSTPSRLLDLAYGPGLRSSRRYLPERLDDMLVCYRCFKEIRNVSAHAGRVPDEYTLAAYTNAVPLVGGLGRNGQNLALPVVVAGRPVQLSLLNAQALCALLLNIVITLDAELAVTRAAEGVLLDRWKNKHPRTQVSVDPIRRKNRLTILNSSVGLPALNDAEALYELLRGAYLVL
jgi:hypothetical protein